MNYKWGDGRGERDCVGECTVVLCAGTNGSVFGARMGRMELGFYPSRKHSEKERRVLRASHTVLPSDSALSRTSAR